MSHCHHECLHPYTFTKPINIKAGGAVQCDSLSSSPFKFRRQRVNFPYYLASGARFMVMVQCPCRVQHAKDGTRLVTQCLLVVVILVAVISLWLLLCLAVIPQILFKRVCRSSFPPYERRVHKLMETLVVRVSKGQMDGRMNGAIQNGYCPCFLALSFSLSVVLSLHASS